MAELKIHKVVASLPGVLEADTVYFVRTGVGFDIYVTNTTGTIVSYPLNTPTPQTGYAVFNESFEENSNLSNNNRQWSVGNGSTGVVNVAMEACEIYAMSFHSEIGGTSAGIELMQNDVSAATETFAGTSGFNVLATPVTFAQGDLLGARTQTVVGTFTDARVTFWCRVPLQGLKGDQGDAGANGNDGAPGDIIWRGAWAAGTYLENEAVEFGGSSYVANTTTTQTPPNTEWDLIAAKGDPGASGGASYCKVENTDTSTNLNLVASGFSTIVPLNGTTILSNADFTPSGNGVQCNFTGVVNVKANVHYTSTGQRTTLMARTRIGGTPTGMIGATGYIRNTSGHSEASMHIDDFFSVNNGDLIEIGVHRESTITTSATLALSGSSNLILNRIE